MNGEKMLVCPTWEDEFQKAINSTGGCFRISMDYSAVDVSWWKELEAIAKKIWIHTGFRIIGDHSGICTEI